jgi:hypothetical protein
LLATGEFALNTAIMEDENIKVVVESATMDRTDVLVRVINMSRIGWRVKKSRFDGADRLEVTMERVKEKQNY